tara:strand:- start:47 stop:274 length:228 start_codon:yes stop_codon:yes gene_type:complete
VIFVRRIWSVVQVPVSLNSVVSNVVTAMVIVNVVLLEKLVPDVKFAQDLMAFIVEQYAQDMVHAQPNTPVIVMWV